MSNVGLSTDAWREKGSTVLAAGGQWRSGQQGQIMLIDLHNCLGMHARAVEQQWPRGSRLLLATGGWRRAGGGRRRRTPAYL